MRGHTMSSFWIEWTQDGEITDCSVTVNESADTTCFPSNLTAFVEQLPTAGKEYSASLVVYSDQHSNTTDFIAARTGNTASPNVNEVAYRPTELKRNKLQVQMSSVTRYAESCNSPVTAAVACSGHVRNFVQQFSSVPFCTTLVMCLSSVRIKS